MRKISIVFILLACWYSCKKVKTTQISQEIKDGFDFKEGSYWVYYESIRHITDTFFLTGYQTYTINGKNSTPYSVEAISYFLIHHQNVTVDSIFDLKITLFENSYSLGVYDNKYFYNGHVNWCLFKAPFQSTTNDCFTLTYKIDEIKLYKNDYRDVWFAFQETLGVNATRLSDSLYIAPNVGIVKMVINHPTYHFRANLNLFGVPHCKVVV